MKLMSRETHLIVPHRRRHISLLLLLVPDLLGHRILDPDLLAGTDILLRLLRILLENGRAIVGLGLLLLLLVLQLLVVLPQVGGVHALLSADKTENRQRGRHEQELHVAAGLLDVSAGLLDAAAAAVLDVRSHSANDTRTLKFKFEL